jgi:histidinol-phosphate/aromatic aminotransferase/cobyric acid decarboxylase-like protein
LLADGAALRDYPDRAYWDLRQAIAAHHGLEPDAVLPGNGAAELFTWAARDAAAAGTSLLPTPGFADYRRALACWDGRWQPLPLPLDWSSPGPGPLPVPEPEPAGGLTVPPGSQVLWITNPHNPSGQLWSRQALEPLLQRFALVIVDEAFLPLVPGGDAQSLVPLLAQYPQLVVIRSLTKLLAIAGLRLGYALGDPARLARWSSWRDPWPVNGLAAAAGDALLGDQRWLRRVQDWVAREGPWLQARLAAIPGLDPRPTAVNYLLLRGRRDGQALELEPLRLALEQRHRILLRDCRSFEGLDGTWLRLALQDRAGNRRLLAALGREWPGLRAGR